MKRKLFLLFCACLAFGPVRAVPSAAALDATRPLVNELMADDLAALKAGRKSAVAVADAARALVANAETEAAKYLLLKTAFSLFLRGKDYDKAADAVEALQAAVPDLPAADVVELVQNGAKGVRSREAPRLFAVYRAAQAQVVAEKERRAASEALAASPDSSTRLRTHAEWCVHAGDWSAARTSFVKLGTDFAAAAAATPSDLSAAANFWWNYEPVVKHAVLKDPADAFKRYAVALYQKGLASGAITGLKKTLAEKRIQQLTAVTATSDAAPARHADPEGAAPAGSGLYLCIDLANGAKANTYPVTYLARAPKDGWSDEYKTTKLVLRRVKHGAFTMGSPASESGRESQEWLNDETQRKVSFAKDFYLGVFPVTQKQWELVMGSNPARFKSNPDAPTCPVETVSYRQIRGATLGCAVPIDGKVDPGSFLQTLRRKTGLATLDLPTGAQWEYACRAGSTTSSYAGKSDAATVGKIAWFAANAAGRTHGVGQKQPNDWGFYDMLGNVMEWCRDRVAPTRDEDVAFKAQKDYLQERAGGNVEARGGMYTVAPGFMRSALRTNNLPVSYVDPRYGFRLSAEAK